MRKSLLLKISRLTGSLCVRFSEITVVFMSALGPSTSRIFAFCCGVEKHRAVGVGVDVAVLIVDLAIHRFQHQRLLVGVDRDAELVDIGQLVTVRIDLEIVGIALSVTNVAPPT